MLPICLKIEAAPISDKESTVLRILPRILTRMMCLALPLGLAIAGQIPTSAPALAGAHDGDWSVLIVTEKGDCDRGYRYNFKVSNGQVRYVGETSANMSGTVAPNGAVKVNIKLSDKGATGTGRLSANAGTGTWQGAGSTGACSGRWDAERR
jgi:hypothetical protein